MLPIVAALVCSLPSLHIVGQNTPVLQRLDKALAEPSDKKAWFVRFEQQCPPSDIGAWRRLQRNVAPNSKQYGELSFALAYYGKDYKANLLGVTRPYRFYNIGFDKYKQEYFGKKDYDYNWDKNWTGYGSTWFALNLLYLKHHDLTSLGFWLDQTLDGGPGEFNTDDLGSLWQRHKIDMLRAANGSPLRMHNLTDALLLDYYDPHGIRKLLRVTRALAHSQDLRVASAAQQLAERLQTHVKEVDDFDKAQKEDRKKVGQETSRPRRAFAACQPLTYDKADLDELSVAISGRRLTQDELFGLSDGDLVILRNVPFARRGYRLRAPRLLDYFSNKAWYRPNTDSEAVAERRCSGVENRNVNAIIAFQKRQRGSMGGAKMQGGDSPGLPALATAVGERNLTENDLNGKTSWQLTLLRNTPYARHGFRFGTPRLTNYFRGKAWYRPDSGNQDVVSGRFNDFERRNVKFAADYQDAHGLRDTP